MYFPTRKDLACRSAQRNDWSSSWPATEVPEISAFCHQLLARSLVAYRLISNFPQSKWALSEGRFAKFRDHAIQVVNLIGGVAIALYAPDGQQLVNTRLELAGPLPKRVEFDVERRAIETEVPQVSGLQKAVLDGQRVVTIAVPVRIAGQIRYALNIGLSPRYLSSLMDEYVSAGLVGSIIDKKGLLLARRPLLDGDELVGRPTIPEVLAHIGEPSALWVKAVSRTGIPTYTSLLRSSQSGWTVNLAVPREAIDGPLHRTVNWIIALTILTFVLGLALARLIAKRFLAEFAGLEKYVFSLRSDVVEPKVGSIAEVQSDEQSFARGRTRTGRRAEATEVASG